MKFHVLTAALLLAPAIALASPMIGGSDEIDVLSKRGAHSALEVTLEHKKQLRVQIFERTAPGRAVVAQLPRATICDVPTKVLRHQCVKGTAQRGAGRVTGPVEDQTPGYVHGFHQSTNSRQVSLSDEGVKPVSRPGPKVIKPALRPETPQKPASSLKS